MDRSDLNAAEDAAVLRLVRGEELDTLSSKLGVTTATLSRRNRILAAGQASLRSRPADERDDEIGRVQAKVDEVTMANELLLERAHLLEAELPMAQQRSRQRGRQIWFRAL